MTETVLTMLNLPLGEPGSGRLRYGAAMALYREGRLSTDVLEVYRICSARDWDDPLRLLRDRGLSAPATEKRDTPETIRSLIDEADRYLSTLPGPGVAEVRSGIAAARGGAVIPPLPSRNPVVDAHLDAALGAVERTHPALASAIFAAAPLLRWVTYDEYPRAEIGETFATGHAFTSLIGGGSPLVAEDFDLGLFLIAPHVLYRDHCHKAPELYAPLTGPHGWRFGPGTPMGLKHAHQPVWNDPFRPHLTKVGPVPFLALFGWTRDVNEPARVLRAADWPALEALRIGGARDG